MRITGFGTYTTWESEGYWYGLPDNWMPTVSVEPIVLTRPGAYGTFGTSVVSQMLIPGWFGYNGPLDPETAFLNLFKKLNPVSVDPRPLRALRNVDLLPITIPAVLQIVNFSDSNEVNVKPVHFVAVQPWWTATEYTTVSGGYT